MKSGVSSKQLEEKALTIWTTHLAECLSLPIAYCLQ